MAEQQLKILLDFEELIKKGKQYVATLGDVGTAQDKAFDDAPSKKLTEEQKKYNKTLTETDKQIGNIKKADASLETKKKLLVKAQQQLTNEMEEYIVKGRNLDGVKKELDKVENAIEGIRKEQSKLNADSKKSTGFFGGLSGSLKTLGTRILAIGVVAKTFDFFKTSAQKAKALESAMSQLSAITGLTGESLDELKTKAKEIGDELKISATTVVEAMQLIGSAKPDLLENADALAAVTREAIVLSKAAKIDLKSAADTLGGSLNQFGASADQANRFINVLAAGAQKGASLIGETAAALKNAGTVAAAIGVSFEQTNAAIQILSEVSIKGGEAGTGLRNVLLTLSTQSDDLNPKVVGLSTALENLGKKNLSTAQLTKLFGKENVVVAQQLVNNAQKVDDLTTSLTGTNTAYEQASTNSDNLEGSLAALNSAVDSFATELGELLVPALKSLVDTVTPMIKSIGSAIKSYKDWASNGREVTKVLEELGYKSRDLVGLQKSNLDALNDNLKSTLSDLGDLDSIDAIVDKMTELKQIQENAIKIFPEGSAAQITALTLVKDAINEVEGAYIDLTGASQNSQKEGGNVRVEVDASNAINTIGEIKKRISELSKERLNLTPNSTELTKVDAEIARLQKLISKSNKNNNGESKRAATEAERIQKQHNQALLKIEQDLQAQKTALQKAARVASVEGDDFDSKKAQVNLAKDLALEELAALEDSLKQQLARRKIYNTLTDAEIAAMSDSELQSLVEHHASLIQLEQGQQQQLNILRGQALSEYTKAIAEIEKAKVKETFADEVEELETEKALLESRINIQQQFFDEKGKLITGEAAIEEARRIELLNIQKKFLNDQISMYESLSDLDKEGLEITEAQFQTTVNNLKAAVNDIGSEIANGGTTEKADIFALLGLEVTDADKEAIIESVDAIMAGMSDSFQQGASGLFRAGQGLADALKNGLDLENFQDIASGIGSLFSSVFDGLISKQDLYIDSLDTRISDARSALKEEEADYKTGAASNVSIEKNKIATLEAEREKALKQREKLVKQQNALDSIAQASSLAAAVANILKGYTTIPFVGIALGAAAIAGMLTMFKNQQSKIKGLYKGTSYVERTNSQRGRDTELRRLDIGERVETADDNAAHWNLFEGRKRGNKAQFAKGVNKFLKQSKGRVSPALAMTMLQGTGIEPTTRHEITTQVQQNFARIEQKQSDIFAAESAKFLAQISGSNKNLERLMQKQIQQTKMQPITLADGRIRKEDSKGNVDLVTVR